MNRVKAFVLAIALGIALANCGGSGSSTPTTPSAPSVTSVTVTSPSGNPIPGQSVQFTATANLSNNTTQNVTNQATWQSSNSGVAAVSGSGMVTAVAAGDAEIRATYQTVTGSTRVTVVLLRVTLSGVVREEGSNGPIPDARVEIVDGQNTGRSVTTPSDGSYSFTDLVAETVTIRTSRSGYDTNSRMIQLQQDTRQDISLKRAAPPPSRILSLMLTQGEQLSGPYAGIVTGPNGFTCALGALERSKSCPSAQFSRRTWRQVRFCRTWQVRSLSRSGISGI